MSSFSLLGEPLVLDLINTLKPTGDQLDASGATESFWRFQQQRAEVSMAALSPGETRELRDLATGLITAARSGEEPSTDAVAAVNALLAAAPEYSVLSVAEGAIRQERVSLAAGTATATKAHVMRSLFDVFDALAAGRLRECAAEGCPQLFVALHAKRRWCTPDVCGNRVRVARFAARAKIDA